MTNLSTRAEQAKPDEARGLLEEGMTDKPARCLHCNSSDHVFRSAMLQHRDKDTHGCYDCGRYFTPPKNTN